MNKWYVSIPVRPDWDADRLVRVINMISADMTGYELFFQTPDEAVKENIRSAGGNPLSEQKILEVNFDEPRSHVG